LGVGVDASKGMIDRANRSLEKSLVQNIRFQVDDAEVLSSLKKAQFDRVICVGALEHMEDKRAVLDQVYRVLNPGGKFLCLTPDADYIWYRKFAPKLKKAVTHLSTDRFLSDLELGRELQTAGFSSIEMDRWTFVPAGDMPSLWAFCMTAAASLGRWVGCKNWQGGLRVSATKSPVS
jgi:2-polyprenyl-6-hydroxyphenyl methylase/3-demethylubiquinone-9 3-methyltransferase